MRLNGFMGLVAIAMIAAGEARAVETVQFESLRSDKVYLREGPTYAHRILWVYRRKGYPVEVLSAWQDWRRIRDIDGTTGWINTALLSDTRTILVIGKKPAPIRADPDDDAKVIAVAEPGVVARLKACKPSICEITSGGVAGWINKQSIWGVRAGESFQ